MIAKQQDAVILEDINLVKLEIDENWSKPKEKNYWKRVYDNGFGLFRKMLKYKIEERGKKYIKINKNYPSSQICSNCKNIKKIPITSKEYICYVCGSTINRDYNAAINIRDEGLRLLTI